MNDNHNPYQVVPRTVDPYAGRTAARAASVVHEAELEPAALSMRLVNYLIDSLVFGALYGFILGVLGAGGMRDPFAYIVVTILVTLAYYVVMECAFGVTVGKLATNTRVVDENGDPPGLGQVIIRSLCRFIPFEPLSLLFSGKRLRGWHDSLSATRVVKKI